MHRRTRNLLIAAACIAGVLAGSATVDARSASFFGDDDDAYVPSNTPSPQVQSAVDFEATNVSEWNIAPQAGAERNHESHVGISQVNEEDLPCAEWRVGGGATSSTGEPAEDEDAPATEGELLAAIVAVNGGNTATQSKKALAQFDQDAVDALWQTILAEEAAVVEGSTSAGGGSGEDVCEKRYYCAAERVDDIISGHIDGEPDGAFAEYVLGYSNTLTANGPTSEVDFNPSDSDDLLSLANQLAEIGWGDPPSGLALPVFNYCRVDTGGPIELDVASYNPTLGFTADLNTEFDIAGSRGRLIDEIRERLEGQPPEMAAIPPIERGYTFVQFPTWLWLENPEPLQEFTVLSQFETIELSGRATFKHVTWQLGDAEVTCELGQMKVWQEGMNPGDKPHCHHIFTELVDYTITATITYEIEERIRYRGHRSYPWQPAGWVEHPTTPVIEVAETTPQMSVHQIVSVNAPQQLSIAEIKALADE